MNRTWAFGPNFSGGNILLNLVDDWDDFQSPYFSLIIRLSMRVIMMPSVYKSLGEKSILAGFQQASHGPMCEEPMYGICFCLSKIEFHTPSLES